jgi:signal transduction histidine kinase
VAEFLGYVALVILIGVVDSVTGVVVAFGVFYIVPIAVATVRCGQRPAMALALTATVVWVIASRRVDESSLATDTMNIGFRFGILSFIVTLLDTVVSALGQARASDRSSRDFLSFAAHQLRTPTATVNATAQGLLAQGGRPEDEEALVRVVTESSRIGRLVASMLRFVRLERGDDLPAETADLRMLCAREVQRWTDLCPLLTIDLVVEGDQPVDVNEEATRETLDILLDNAQRHARTRIVVTAVSDGSRVRVRVRDDGPGLSPSDTERAFEPLVSLDGLGGSGLGLAIGRRMIELQGGTLVWDDGAFAFDVPCVAPATEHSLLRNRALTTPA